MDADIDIDGLLAEFEQFQEMPLMLPNLWIEAESHRGVLTFVSRRAMVDACHRLSACTHLLLNKVSL
eukprot:1159952-Pelagomonas_calceolata.AAC.10